MSVSGLWKLLAVDVCGKCKQTELSKNTSSFLCEVSVSLDLWHCPREPFEGQGLSSSQRHAQAVNAFPKPSSMATISCTFLSLLRHLSAVSQHFEHAERAFVALFKELPLGSELSWPAAVTMSCTLNYLVPDGLRDNGLPRYIL